jgi:hypothetical protein
MNYLLTQWGKLSPNFRACLEGFGIGVLVTAVGLWLLCK